MNYEKNKSHAQSCEIRHDRREDGRGGGGGEYASHLVEIVVCFSSLQVHLLFVPFVHAGKQLVEHMEVPLLPRLHRNRGSDDTGEPEISTRLKTFLPDKQPHTHMTTAKAFCVYYTLVYIYYTLTSSLSAHRAGI